MFKIAQTSREPVNPHSDATFRREVLSAKLHKTTRKTTQNYTKLHATSKEAKKINLKICFELRGQIAAVERRLAALAESFGAMTARYAVEGLPATPRFDSALEKLVLVKLEVEQKLRDLQEKLAAAKVQVLTWLLAAELTATEFEIMRRRYVECQQFEEIILALCYSKPHVYYIHRLAREKVLAAASTSTDTGGD